MHLMISRSWCPLVCHLNRGLRVLYGHHRISNTCKQGSGVAGGQRAGARSLEA